MAALTAGRRYNHAACGASRLVCRSWARAWGPAQLTALRVNGEADQMPAEWAERVPNLEFLDCSGWRYSYSLSDVRHLVPPLQTLTGITSLDLSLCEAVTDRVLATLTSLTGLTDLNLSQCSPLPDYGLTALRGLTRLTRLNLMQYGIDFDEWRDDRLLTFLPCLTNLTDLQLSACGGVTEEGLMALQPLKYLAVLDLSNCLVEDDWLTALRPLKQLGTLNLAACPRITGRGLHALQSVRTLDLSESGVLEDGLSELQSMTGLTCLHLSAVKLSQNFSCDEYVGLLQPLTGLTCLNISSWQLTQAGLRNLQTLTSLTCLDLTACGLSDSDMVPVQQLTRLTSLRLSCNRLTESGLASLTSLPGLISLDYPANDGSNLSTSVIDLGPHPPELCSLKSLASLNTTCACQEGSSIPSLLIY